MVSAAVSASSMPFSDVASSSCAQTGSPGTVRAHLAASSFAGFMMFSSGCPQRDNPATKGWFPASGDGRPLSNEPGARPVRMTGRSPGAAAGRVVRRWCRSGRRHRRCLRSGKPDISRAASGKPRRMAVSVARRPADAPNPIGSEPEGISVGHALAAMLGAERRHRAGFVEPHPAVELLRQRRVGIMAHQLGLGAVDNADEPLEPLLGETPAQAVVTPHVEQKTLDPRVVTDPLVTVLERGAHALDLRFAAPVAGGGDGAGMGSEPDQCRRVAPALSAELADIEFTPDGPHLGRPRVTDMAVVRPDDRLCLRPARREQVFEGLEHVAVTQVPAFRTAVIHDPVVALGGLHEPGILSGVEETLAVPGLVFETFPEDLAQLRHNLTLAGTVTLRQHRPAVGRRIALPGREAAIALARDRGGFGIDLVEIVEHRGDRAAHVVDVEPVETGPSAGFRRST